MQNHEALIIGCKKNDRKAQQQLFEKFASKMYGHCLRYCTNADDAKDVLQEGFIKVFEKISTLKEASQLEGWMSRIFINLALSNWRKQHRSPDFVEIDSIGDAEEVNEDLDDSFAGLAADNVLQWMNELPDNQRMVLNMYAIDGLSHQEIADLMQTTVSNTKSILSRARKSLRERLNSETKK